MYVINIYTALDEGWLVYCQGQWLLFLFFLITILYSVIWQPVRGKYFLACEEHYI